MKFWKSFSDKASAVGTKIPSPCIAEYKAENEMDYFRPMGQTTVKEEIFTIESGANENYVSEYCDIHDEEVLRIVAQKYGTNGQNPKIADVLYHDFFGTYGAVLSGKTNILEVRGLGPVLSNNTTYLRAFGNLLNVKSIDVSDIDFSKGINFKNMFNYCLYLEEIKGINDIDLSSAEDLTAMFQRVGFSGNVHNVAVDVSKWNIPKNAVIMGLFNITYFFNRITGLEKIDVSQKASLQKIFNNCIYLERISDISGWDTSNVTNMQGLFNCCHRLISMGNLTNWKTPKVTTFESLFYSCSTLTSIGDVSNWNVSNATSLAWMFFGCGNLRNIGDLSLWNTSKVKDFRSMFCHSRQLTNIGNLSGWSFQAASATGYMFADTNIENLHEYIGEWDLSNVSSNEHMFGESNLKHIVFPKNIKRMDNGMYLRMDNYIYADTSAVTIPDTVEILKPQVFLNQYNVKKMHIGKNVKQLGEIETAVTFNDVFPQMLEEVTIDPQNQYFKVVDNIVLSKDGKECFGGGTCYFSKTDIIIPEGVEIVRSGSFRGMLRPSDLTNTALWQTNYEKGMHELNFSNIILTGITFPSTTTFIGDRIMQYAGNLNAITVLATTPPTLYTTTFYNNRKPGAKLYVPSASVNAYKTATNWSAYASIIEAIPNS